MNIYNFFIESVTGSPTLIPLALSLNRNILSYSVTIQLLKYIMQEAEELV